MFLKDLLFPKFCVGCGFLGIYLCLKCQKNLRPIIHDACIYCKKPSLYGLTHPICKKKFGVDGCISLFYYDNLMKKIVKSMKYRLALDVWRDFKNAIVPKTVEKLLFFKDRRDLLLQPIPLHPNRLRERGFNQAKEVAEFINKYTNIPFIDVLQRTKDTPAQAQLTRQKDRYDNIRNAFKLIDFQRIEDKNIVLIDDVITTGWTVKEAAMILKKNRALKVFVVTIARG